MDSILNSVKSYLGIEEDDTAFDTDLLMAINAVFFTLNQLGCCDNVITVSDYSKTWSSCINEESLPGVRMYVGMKVRMLFDPPTNSYVMNALQTMVDEFEWRIRYEAEKIDV